jgi:hypothetical protein
MGMKSMSSMLQMMKHTKDKVAAILNEWPETRNCDKKLCVSYWKLVDGIQELDQVERATSPEAIRRARQMLNESGRYLATDPDVLKRRRQAYKEVKEGIKKIS